MMDAFVVLCEHESFPETHEGERAVILDHKLERIPTPPYFTTLEDLLR